MFYNKKKTELAPFGRYAHFHYSRFPDFLIVFYRLNDEHDRVHDYNSSIFFHFFLAKNMCIISNLEYILIVSGERYEIVVHLIYTTKITFYY